VLALKPAHHDPRDRQFRNVRQGQPISANKARALLPWRGLGSESTAAAGYFFDLSLPRFGPAIAVRNNAMKLAQFRRNDFGLPAALCVFSALAVLYSLNWFRWTDDLLRDCGLWLTPSMQQKDQLLLVYAEPQLLESASPELITLLDSIEQQSPKKIGIVATGPSRNFSALNHIPRASALTVGFPLQKLLTSESPVNKNKFRTGFIDLNHSKQPIYRNGVVSTQHAGSRLNSFEFEVAKSVSPLSDNLPSAHYGIRYAGGPNTLAHIDSSALLKGNLIRELIRGKIVLIGPEYSQRFHMLTPTTKGDARMSRLEIRGNMVASLVNENYATKLGTVSSFMLLAFVTLVSFQVARQTPKHWLPTLILAHVAIALAMIAVCYWLTSVWLPATALLLAGLVSTIIATMQRFSKLEDYVQFWKIRSTVREAHIKSRFEVDAWQAIGDVTYQMFQPTRVVMMELRPGVTHLKRVRSIGCDYSQIYEKRLDYKRAPYWDPIQNKAPIQSLQRGFFTPNPGVKEAEYMLPLVHGIHIYGVIAMALERETLERWNDFDAFLARFCSEMSQLIAGSQQAAREGSRRLKFIERCSTFPEERSFVEIQTNSQLQDDLIERVDIAFDCSESAMATFDIYGRIIRRNSNLNRLLQKTELSGSGSTCIDIISAISGQSPNTARQTFRDAILYNKSAKYLVDRAFTDAPMMMYIKPMQLQDDEARTSIETHGLLLEVVDGSVFQEIRQWNHELSAAIVPEVLEKATHLEHKTALLKQPIADNAALNDLFGSVGDTVSEIVSVLQSCQDLRGRQVTESPENFFLLNTIPVWRSVKARFEEELTQRSITILDNDAAETEVKAIANPILLERSFIKILEFLLGNAFDESEIQFEIIEQIDGFEFRFTNQGGGTPVDTLRKSLDQAANETVSRRAQKYLNLDTAQIDQLQQIDAWVSQWGGSFGVQNLPHCITVSVTLSNIQPAPIKTAPTNTDSRQTPAKTTVAEQTNPLRRASDDVDRSTPSTQQ
jgi:CHASE2 domain-containing sensor protein